MIRPCHEILLSNKKKIKQSLHATWMNLKNIMPRERRWTQKKTYCMISFIRKFRAKPNSSYKKQKVIASAVGWERYRLERDTEEYSGVKDIFCKLTIMTVTQVYMSKVLKLHLSACAVHKLHLQSICF